VPQASGPVETFRLEPRTQRLWRGDDEVRLRPKAFALLHHLLQRADQVVSKRELLETIWLGTDVSDAVLKVSIFDIRRALGDRPGGGRLIETRHRRGYRLMASICRRESEQIVWCAAR
jgi:DNA-binding winged helix-turn-helix (wHTH) protein